MGFVGLFWIDLSVDTLVHVAVVLVLVRTRHLVELEPVVIHVFQVAANELDQIGDIVCGGIIGRALLHYLLDCVTYGFLGLIGWFLGKPVRNLTTILG